eukprot:TRINITY_DN3330_c0_g1_i3.p1 TRINITY_DN3330_c0_g1~~TRINITY_DN3330_c0_g1_i3.p1  ORF type:complete len:106 (+),score=35.54 TRINITY_DN3330_c0_g1_i3:400-717(+)
MRAELEVGYKVFRERYTSKVIWIHPTEIQIVASDSELFEHLSSKWMFRDQRRNKEHTNVLFELKYKFRNSLHNMVTENVFLNVQKEMLDAFEKRCEEIKVKNRKK